MTEQSPRSLKNLPKKVGGALTTHQKISLILSMQTESPTPEEAENLQKTADIVIEYNKNNPRTTN